MPCLRVCETDLPRLERAAASIGHEPRSTNSIGLNSLNIILIDVFHVNLSCTAFVNLHHI